MDEDKESVTNQHAKKENLAKPGNEVVASTKPDDLLAMDASALLDLLSSGDVNLPTQVKEMVKKLAIAGML